MKSVSLECRNIRLSYGRTEVLRDLSLSIAPGEFFALLGPSGSGKSSLLRLIAGFNQHQSGQLLVDGQDISSRPPWARNIGMVFQNYALWPHMTVRDNVAFGLVERRVDRTSITRRVDAALALVGLSAYAQRRPNQLSGGQQQRVALARTLVIEPDVLLLDEPLSNLDKNLRVQMRQELLSLQRRLGITTVFVTHDQEEAMTTADRMAVVDGGVLQQVGDPITLFDRPVNRFVAEFVGTMNLLPGRIAERQGDRMALEIEGVGEMRLAVPDELGAAAARDPVALSFRPHAARLRSAGGGAEAAGAVGQDALSLSGVIAGSEFLGESIRYRIDVGPHALTVDAPHVAGQPRQAVGTAVGLEVDHQAIRVLPGR